MNLLKMSQTRRLLLVFCALFALGVSSIWAQNKAVTIDATNTKLLKILHKIERQTKYLFVYGDEVDVTQQVTVHAQNKPLSTVLTELFDGTRITYAVDRSNIVLSMRPVVEKHSGLIKGLVVDVQGEPLIGATVVVKGSSMGTLTDMDGRFQLNIPEITSQTALVVKYVGYEPQTVIIGNKTTFKIVMQEEANALSEVVVTALGIKREEKALSYNVQQVKSDEILMNKDANFVNSLNGKVAGVNINSSSSGVGGASKVVMRGTKSIAQSSNALYVIDGVPMFNLNDGAGSTGFGSEGSSEPIADINPEDIESVSVLTGAAAAALYGSHAANGAIVITTKSGKVGKTSVTVSSNTEFMNVFVTPDFQNEFGTGDLTSSTAVSDKSWGRALTPENNYNYKPSDDYFRTGVVNTQTVSLSTGTERNQTYLSAASVQSAGVIPNNKYSRYNFTFRNTTSFLNDKMKLDLGGSYIRQKDQNMVNQGTYANPLVSAYLFPRGDDWADIRMFERYDTASGYSKQYWPQGLDEFVGQNPYWINYRNLRNNNKDRYTFNAGLSYDVYDWLNLAGRVRIDNSVTDFTKRYFASTNLTIASGSEKGFYGIRTSKEKQTYADFLVNIDKRFMENLTFNANIGASYSDMRYDAINVEGGISNKNGLANVFTICHLDDITHQRSQTGWREQTQSVFASAELGYKSAYYLTLTARNDWPSQLAGPKSNTKSFFYPSVGTSFVLSEIFSLPKQIEYAKVRASYASVGTPFPRNLANPMYAWDEANNLWRLDTNYPMYDLKPERTDSYELGLSTRFLKGFNMDLSWYMTYTKNQTFDPKISASSAYSTLIVQTGKVRNMGWELALGYKHKWGNFGWQSNYTLSSNRNKIMELVEDYRHPETGALITKDNIDVGGLAQARFILKKGGSLGDLYSMTELRTDSEGNIYVNEEGKVMRQKNEEGIKVGSVFPKANMAWRNNFSYKNFEAGFMISARIGGVVYSATQAAMDLYGVSQASADARNNGGILINGNDLIDAHGWYDVISAESGMPQYYTYSATNVRLQEASIGYTLPKNILWGVGEMKISLVGRNLLMLYNKAPFDPENVATTGNYYQGIDNFMTPSTRNIGFNIRMKF